MKLNLIKILSIPLLFILVDCQSTLEKQESENDCSKLLQGVYNDSIPIGIWIYRDYYGNPIAKLDYQINVIDTFQFQNLSKFFSFTGELIRIEAIRTDSTRIILMSEQETQLTDIALGEILVKEYCNSCHKMTTQGLAPSLKSLNISDSILTATLSSDHHKLSNSKLVWETKASLNFITEDQISAITKYVTQWKPILNE